MTIEGLNRAVCDYLWRMDEEYPPIDSNEALNSNQALIWPQYRGSEKKSRFSEQEARFAMALLLSQGFPWKFSIETPTQEVYQFSGTTPISAQTDLTLFTQYERQYVRSINVEFKAHQPEQKAINKDIEKLIREPFDGNWFHVIEDMDSQTIVSICDKMTEASNSFKQKQNQGLQHWNPISEADRDRLIHFCFCCVKKRWACFRSVSKGDFLNDPQRIFAIDYKESPTNVSVTSKNEWSIW